jgi:hypothetical protein
MSVWSYYWTYSFFRVMIWTIVGSAVGILFFLGISAGVVSRRTRKSGKRGALSVSELNVMSQKKGGVSS